MGFFKKLMKATVDTAMVPVEVVKDVVTLGGVCVGDRIESYTVERAKRICRDLEEAYEELDK